MLLWVDVGGRRNVRWWPWVNHRSLAWCVFLHPIRSSSISLVSAPTHDHILCVALHVLLNLSYSGWQTCQVIFSCPQSFHKLSSLARLYFSGHTVFASRFRPSRILTPFTLFTTCMGYLYIYPVLLPPRFHLPGPCWC